MKPNFTDLYFPPISTELIPLFSWFQFAQPPLEKNKKHTRKRKSTVTLSQLQAQTQTHTAKDYVLVAFLLPYTTPASRATLFGFDWISDSFEPITTIECLLSLRCTCCMSTARCIIIAGAANAASVEYALHYCIPMQLPLVTVVARCHCTPYLGFLCTTIAQRSTERVESGVCAFVCECRSRPRNPEPTIGNVRWAEKVEKKRDDC